MPAERLIDILWDGRPPTAAAANLHSYLSNLRRALAEAEQGRNPICRRNGRYALVARSEQVDADQFDALVEDRLRAADRAEHGVAVERLSRAVGLWRSSTVFEGLSIPGSLRDDVIRLEQLRIRAIDGLLSARLALGQHESLVPDLEAEVERHPLHEPFWAYLMLALYRSSVMTKLPIISSRPATLPRNRRPRQRGTRAQRSRPGLLAAGPTFRGSVAA